MDEPATPCERCGMVGTWFDPCLCTVRAATRLAAVAIVVLFCVAGTAVADAPADSSGHVSSEQLTVPVMLFLGAVVCVGGALFKLGRYSGTQDRRFQQIEDSGTERGKELEALKQVVGRIDRDMRRLLWRFNLEPEGVDEPETG